MAKLTPGQRTKGEGKPRISPADIVFLVVVFCLVCTTFAITEGLVLGARSDGLAFQKVGGGNVLQVTCLADGGVEIRGRRVDLEDLRSAILSAAAGWGRLVVVAEYGLGTSPGFVADVLDTLRAAGVERISVREVAR